MFNDAATPDTWVGLILIEYIEGLSIEAMCTHDHSTGYLQPPLGQNVSLHSDQEAEGKGQTKMLTLDRRVCLDVIQSLLGQIVVCMHPSVSVPDIFPRNVFLTLRNNGLDLQTLRVVMLDHRFSSVWEHTRAGKAGLPAYFSGLKLPPHPWEQFGIRGKMRQFLGWIPEEWDDRKQLLETTTQGAATTTPATGQASSVPGTTEKTGIAKSIDDWLVDCFWSFGIQQPRLCCIPRGCRCLGSGTTSTRREDRDRDCARAGTPRRARTQDISPRSPTRKAEAEGEGGGGDQETSMTSISSTSQIANSPSHQYLVGIIAREATGSGSNSDDQQQQ
ncbi:hypothetical protein CSAL01_05295 [Colletotrichum salicis]|uniref:Uncharacterized protein n=1 Tax=Colletotrichum salicis TaxID=1209931 RepID=A0A135RTL4_9PEZI|nr:hypothetical protein CSAL01_05295 [Colletotrichum salicis]